jgi:NADH-quinone oxidoreductase subunit L
VYKLAIFLPLIGSAAAALIDWSVKDRHAADRAAQVATCLCMLVAGAISIPILRSFTGGGAPRTDLLFTWIQSGTLDVAWAIRFDAVSAVMIFVVTTVSTAIHIYACGYMHGDKSVPRFMSYLSLFTFFMLMLVTSDNFVQLFFGWEGVGLVSYLLIGFWYEKPSANAAAIKAFLVNRIGDFGFVLGIAGVFLIFGTLQFDAVFAAVAEKATLELDFLGMHVNALTCVCLLLFMGAMGKSAQLGLHTWLPDAMEGPTPVSALIHAATMVTAGVVMMARLSPLFEYSATALAFVTFIGASTAFFAATVGLVQNDIKRVIAYSTCSQLGYMFFATGVSAYQAGMFHLTTHAFFKALLFLGAGSVIHAMSGEQDMRKMGGIWRFVPVTYLLMWIGSLALAGIGIPDVFGFAGFYSKDIILEAAWSANTAVGTYAYWLGVLAALLTAFYSWRLLILTFHGKPRADEHTMEHVHESPRIMIWPLYYLAAGAILAGFIGYPYFVGELRESFWGEAIRVLHDHDAIEAAHHAPFWVGTLPLVMGVLGIALAYVFYVVNPSLPEMLAARLRGLYLFLYNKWYFDELYDRIFVRPALALGRELWKTGDGAVIDGLGPDGLAATTVAVARRASRLQTGYVYHYAFVMLVGVVGLITWYLIARTL